MYRKDKDHFYRYFAVSSEEKKLGLCLYGAGCSYVKKETIYPLKDNPNHHYFIFDKGRRLCNYQFLFITEGKGLFESELSGKHQINAGDLFILFPNIWHRFAPNRDTGWTEYWIEINGTWLGDNYIENFFEPQKPVFKTEFDSILLDYYKDIIAQIDIDDLTLQYSILGLVVNILSRIIVLKKFQSLNTTKIEKQLRQGKIMLENLTETISPESIACEIGLSYSLFRTEFKRYTGFSPSQYQLQYKVQKAKLLLSRSDISIKEISYQLGFYSSNYFSRVFKQKTGLRPLEFRSEKIC